MVSPDVVFGLDSKLVAASFNYHDINGAATTADAHFIIKSDHHFTEVDLIQVLIQPTTITTTTNTSITSGGNCTSKTSCSHDHHVHHPHPQTKLITSSSNDIFSQPLRILKQDFEIWLQEKFSSEDVFRIKGYVPLMLTSTESSSTSKMEWFIVNWAFGRYTLTPLNSTTAINSSNTPTLVTKLTFMGGDLFMYLERVKLFFNSAMVISSTFSTDITFTRKS